jgi:uncharacterized protein (TIGR00369 family)
VTREDPTPPDVRAGERFYGSERWEDAADGGPHIWSTLGYRRTSWKPGSTSLEWDAGLDYTFPAAAGPVVQGGLVTALLDAAMGGATWTVLDSDQAFLTADLRVEFLRPTRPGTLSASGRVVRRTRRVVFCAADLYDGEGSHLAAALCTQVVLPESGPAGRAAPGDPPEDGRG